MQRRAASGHSPTAKRKLSNEQSTTCSVVRSGCQSPARTTLLSTSLMQSSAFEARSRFRLGHEIAQLLIWRGLAGHRRGGDRRATDGFQRTDPRSTLGTFYLARHALTRWRHRGDRLVLDGVPGRARRRTARLAPAVAKHAARTSSSGSPRGGFGALATSAKPYKARMR